MYRFCDTIVAKTYGVIQTQRVHTKQGLRSIFNTIQMYDRMLFTLSYILSLSISQGPVSILESLDRLVNNDYGIYPIIIETKIISRQKKLIIQQWTPHCTGQCQLNQSKKPVFQKYTYTRERAQPRRRLQTVTGKIGRV